jgi:glycosyltransferase involved in cell wall biosynthesis
MQNFLRIRDVVNELHLNGFEVVKQRYRMLLPVRVPLVSFVVNRVLAQVWGINQLGVTEVIVARPAARLIAREDYSYSVVVPCRNEAGHIADIVRRVPKLGRSTELILVDDRSTDGTAQEIARCRELRDDIRVRTLTGPGVSKAEAVRAGFRVAEGDVLMILDADLAVAPEELPKFAEAIVSGSGDFINGVRFVYPQQHGAMRLLNVLGNRAFAWLVSTICEQPISDTLCGTKVFFRRDWQRIDELRDFWGPRDRWGDFEQLFGASKLGLRIVDLPVHYMTRRYGETKMNRRFHNGWHMLRLCRSALARMRWA